MSHEERMNKAYKLSTRCVDEVEEIRSYYPEVYNFLTARCREDENLQNVNKVCDVKKINYFYLKIEYLRK